MGMKAPVTGSGDGQPRELPLAGNYLAVCNGVYMLGTQPGYQGGPANMQVMLSFELHKRRGPVRDSQGRVFEASKIMNVTANIKSTLTAYAGALRGQDYTESDLQQIQKDGGLDVEDVLGRACRLTLVHETKNDKTKDKIKGIAPLDPEDDVAPKIDGDEIYWDWTLGIECPKRIAYFWNRAQENPDGEGEHELVGAGATLPPLEAHTDDDDLGF